MRQKQIEKIKKQYRKWYFEKNIPILYGLLIKLQVFTKPDDTPF